MQCSRRIEFDAGHRVIGHQSRCKFLHGHRYALEITAQAMELNNLGMVVDFTYIKSIVQSWVNDHLDHNIILSIQDKSLGDNIALHTGQKIYYLQNNPTAENIAMHFKTNIIPKLFIDTTFEITKVKLFETPNCFVEV